MSVLKMQSEVITGGKRKASEDVEQLPQDTPISSEPSSPSILAMPNKRNKSDEGEESKCPVDCICEDCISRRQVANCQCKDCTEKKEDCSGDSWKYLGSWSLTTDQSKYANLDGLTQETRDVYDVETEEVAEIDLSANELAAYPSSPEQSYEISSDDDSMGSISDDDIKMYGFQFSAYTRQQRAAQQLYAVEKDKGEPHRFTVKWRGPKDSIWMSSLNMLRNMRSPSNSFRRHEVNNGNIDNKSLRAVFYRAFGVNSFGSHTQAYDVRRNLTLFKVVETMTQSHSACRLLHTMYECCPSVIEHNCDVSLVDSSEAISAYGALLGYLNIKDSFMCLNPYTWVAPSIEDCVSKQRNPMPEPLMNDLSNDLQYSRRQIPHDAGAWGILPLEVVRYNMWLIMYRLDASDECNDIVHAGNGETGVLYNRDTIFRALSVYKAMTAEHSVYKPTIPSAIDCIHTVECNHAGGDVEVVATLSRAHGYEKRKKINRAFYAALHTCIQGLCMHYIQKGSLTEEDQVKITEAVLQWYAEEWSIYRCNGCDVNTMGERCFYDITRELYSGESHLGAGGCATPKFILHLLTDIFEHDDVDGQDEDHVVVDAIRAVMRKAYVEVELFEY